MKLKELVDSYERTLVVRSLISSFGRRTVAAKELGVAPSTLWNLIKKHRIGSEIPGGMSGRKNRPRERRQVDGFGAPLDQLDVERPFLPLPLDVALLWGPKGSKRRQAVPMEHQPLGSAALSACVEDGLDVGVGELVLDSNGRWCMVWNDAITTKGRRS